MYEESVTVINMSFMQPFPARKETWVCKRHYRGVLN